MLVLKIIFFKKLIRINAINKQIWNLNKKISNYFKKKVLIINPDSRKKKIWDILIVILTFINFFVLTIEMAFFMDAKFPISSYWLIFFLKCFNFLIYAIDIFLNFLTGFHLGGTLINDVGLIKKHYFTNFFLWDIISFVPVFLFAFESYLIEISEKMCFLNLLFFFILKKFSVKMKEFKAFLSLENESFENWFSIGVLFLRTLFVAHLFACLWYLIGMHSNSNNTWIQPFENFSWQLKYINSLYWSLITMVTVGYGDIVPRNEIEKTFCIFTTLVGFTLFGITMGTFSDIIRKMNAKDESLEHFLYFIYLLLLFY